jgi:hypothetical protein
MRELWNMYDIRPWALYNAGIECTICSESPFVILPYQWPNRARSRLKPAQIQSGSKRHPGPNIDMTSDGIIYGKGPPI